MKIFYPLEVFYPSQAGGPANTIYWITKNLKKHGFEPIIVATNKGIKEDFTFNKWLMNDAGRAIYIKTLFLHFPFYQTIISLLHFYRSDVVHISSFFFPTAFVTAFAARFLKKKLVWSARGELDKAALAHSNYRKRPILWLIKKVIGQYPVFHSTCDEETEYIKTVFGKTIRVAQIPNYMEIPERVERQGKNYLLYIGRIHPKKAIGNLIEALARSNCFLSSNYVLKIAGRGKKEFETEIKKLIRKYALEAKVELVGQIEGAEKQRLLADAYFTIMPSHSENFGVVVLESLAQSTPAIASKGSPWESLELKKVGFWVDNSPEELAKQIDKILLLSAAEYENYRAACRDFVVQEFDIEKNINKWINLYKSL